MGSLASSDADAAGDETGSESSDSEWDDDTTPWLPGLSKNAPPERVFQAFRYQSTCHAVACEAPALVIESLVRALAYGMGSIALLVLACFCAHAAARRKRAAVYIREAIIFATSLPSFVVPGILPLSVYVAVVGHIAQYALAVLRMGLVLTSLAVHFTGTRIWIHRVRIGTCSRCGHSSATWIRAGLLLSGVVLEASPKTAVPSRTSLPVCHGRWPGCAATACLTAWNVDAQSTRWTGCGGAI